MGWARKKESSEHDGQSVGIWLEPGRYPERVHRPRVGMSEKHSPHLPTLTAFYQGMRGKEKRMSSPGAGCQSKARGSSSSCTRVFPLGRLRSIFRSGFPPRKTRRALTPLAKDPDRHNKFWISLDSKSQSETGTIYAPGIAWHQLQCARTPQPQKTPVLGRADLRSLLHKQGTGYLSCRLLWRLRKVRIIKCPVQSKDAVSICSCLATSPWFSAVSLIENKQSALFMWCKSGRAGPQSPIFSSQLELGPHTGWLLPLY